MLLENNLEQQELQDLHNNQQIIYMENQLVLQQQINQLEDNKKN
jgi:hypothetical protein